MTLTVDQLAFSLGTCLPSRNESGLFCETHLNGKRSSLKKVRSKPWDGCRGSCENLGRHPKDQLTGPSDPASTPTSFPTHS